MDFDQLLDGLNDVVQDTFGTAQAVIHFQGGGTREITVIFDEVYYNTQTGEYDMDALDPRCSAKDGLLDGVTRGDEIHITSSKVDELFDVLTAPQPDGGGFSMVKLARKP